MMNYATSYSPPPNFVHPLSRPPLSALDSTRISNLKLYSAILLIVILLAACSPEEPAIQTTSTTDNLATVIAEQAQPTTVPTEAPTVTLTTTPSPTTTSTDMPTS